MNQLIQIYFITSAVIAIIGVYALLSNRNMIKTIIALEIITSSINLNFLALGSHSGNVDSLAQSIVFTSIVIGAAIAAVALSLIIHAFKHYGTIDLKKLRRLRW